MKKIIRITSHQTDTDRVNFLQAVFGPDTEVVTDDIEYGSDPVGAVRELIDRHGGPDAVAAVEAIAPFPVLQKLVDARRPKADRPISVPLIRAQFERDRNGRAKVVGKEEDSGRDILAFSHYEELVRIEFQTRPLISS